MHIVLCRHVKTNGLQCSAAALTGTALCYFHTRLHQGHARYRQSPATRAFLDEAAPGQTIELPPLEDRQSIQLALSQVINALAACKLEPKRATALLYGLQLASSNAAKLYLEPHARDGIRTVLEDPATPGLDLAIPGAIYDTDPPEETFDDEQDEDEEYEQEIEARVNERLAEIQAANLESENLEAHSPKHAAQKLEPENEELPTTIPTLQATAETTTKPGHRVTRPTHRATKPGGPSFPASPERVGYRAEPDRSPSNSPQPLRTLKKVPQSPPSLQHQQRFISLLPKEPPIAQATARIAATRARPNPASQTSLNSGITNH